MFDLIPPEYLRPMSALDRTMSRMVEGLTPTAPGKPFWTPNDGPQTMAFYSLADEVFYGGRAGGGKALDERTLIPTPKGYVPIGSLRIGDQVFGRDGNTYTVVAVSGAMTGHRCFEVQFEDGSTLIADADHLWTVQCDYLAARIGDPCNSVGGTFTTLDLFGKAGWIIHVPSVESILGARRYGRRRITAIREVPSVPVCCIGIDSPDHLYLATTSHIPTHNTDLLLGLGGTAHRHTVIFRRVYPSMRSLVERSRELYGKTAQAEDHIPLIEQIIQGNAGKSRAALVTTLADYNGSEHIWRFNKANRIVEFSSLQHEWDKEAHRGRPRDLYGWDEVTEFTESQYRFVNGWLRSTYPNQRCRIVATGNPPTSAEGAWVIRYWAPWLDTEHELYGKVAPGELVWFVNDGQQDVIVPDNQPVMINGEALVPRSRTFIPASLEHTPQLSKTNYKATLQALPEPLRSQLLKGDFSIRASDPAWQVIPTAWVMAANDRWKRMGRPLLQPRAVGVDVARGGADNTVIALLLGTYFELYKRPGRETPKGEDVVNFLAEFLTGRETPIAIDIIGVGSSPYDELLRRGYEQVLAINNSAASDALDRTGTYGFTNLRAESYWAFREALDPDSGEAIALPPDNELIAELCAPRYKVLSGKYQLEPKDAVSARLGRSPDLADAVVMAWYRGTRREEGRMSIW